MYRNNRKKRAIEMDCQSYSVILLTKALGKIENYMIQHIIKAIFDCVLPKVQLQVAHRSLFSPENVNKVSITTSPAIPMALFPTAPPANKLKSWAKVICKNISNRQKPDQNYH